MVLLGWVGPATLIVIVNLVIIGILKEYKTFFEIDILRDGLKVYIITYPVLLIIGFFQYIYI